MRFFFKTRKFKTILITVLTAAAVLILSLLLSGVFSPVSDLLSAVAVPVQRIGADISDSVKSLRERMSDNSKLLLENEKLRNEINTLREKLADYDTLSAENGFYKNYLEIKDANPDFLFESAIIISRDPDDSYGNFTVNKGSLDGLALYDPVITDSGLVGYVSVLGLKTAKIRTLLDSEITIGVNDSRTGDAGLISGEPSLASRGLTRLYNLSRSCNIAVGDYIVTSGEGIFPEGLLVGTVDSIKSDRFSSSLYAEIKPFSDFGSAREVMIITHFDGQGGLQNDK